MLILYIIIKKLKLKRKELIFKKLLIYVFNLSVKLNIINLII